MSTPELLPCPFCGGEPSLTTGGPGNAYVRCMVCQCTGDDAFPERVITAWNTRASQAEIERLTTALRQARADLEKAGYIGAGEWGSGDPEINHIDTALSGGKP